MKATSVSTKATVVEGTKPCVATKKDRKEKRNEKEPGFNEIRTRDLLCYCHHALLEAFHVQVFIYQFLLLNCYCF